LTLAASLTTAWVPGAAYMYPRFLRCQQRLNPTVHISRQLYDRLQSAPPGSKLPVVLFATVHQPAWSADGYVLSHAPQQAAAAAGKSPGRQHSGSYNVGPQTAPTAASDASASDVALGPFSAMVGMYKAGAVRISRWNHGHHMDCYLSPSNPHDIVLFEQVRGLGRGCI